MAGKEARPEVTYVPSVCTTWPATTAADALLILTENDVPTQVRFACPGCRELLQLRVCNDHAQITKTRWYLSNGEFGASLLQSVHHLLFRRGCGAKFKIVNNKVEWL